MAHSPEPGFGLNRCFVRDYDLVFMKNFAQVILGLVLITFILILLGMYFNSKLISASGQVQQAAANARIAPVGAVFAGETGAAAAAAAAAEAAAASKGVAAYGGTLDGGEIYAQLCTGCHTSGAAGAPKLEKAAWGARIAQGTDTLHKHAIDGIRSMPARGGNPSLTDEQVSATVDWMLGNLQ